jgi:isopentenyl phosphate kinase
MHELVFLKLGGSLITDKTQRYAARLDKLQELAREIEAALGDEPGLRLVLGHGSGSFGHFAVTEHFASHLHPPSGTAATGDERRYWQGFSEVWYRASELNRLVVEALHESRVAAISLAPSAMVRAADGIIAAWDLSSLEAAIDCNLVAVIHGDIVFDAVRGGTVLSTETLMSYVAHYLKPRRILLAGIEEGVWSDFPTRHEKIDRITAASYPSVVEKIGGSHGTDVTGGMKAKVEQMLGLVAEIPDLTARIFSGEESGNVKNALANARLGTLVTRDEYPE